MPKTILITLNNSGNDPGPYDLTLIDGSNNETPWPSNPVTKAQLTAGYQMVVPDLIVKVKVKSKTCTTFIQLTIPTTQCPCRIVNFGGGRGSNGIFNFYQCGQTASTNLTVGDTIVSYCVDMNKPIVQSSLIGDYTDTGVCCTGPIPTTTSTTTTTTTTTIAPPSVYEVDVRITSQSLTASKINVLYSTNGGSTWTTFITGLTMPVTPSRNNFFGLTFAPGSNILFAIVPTATPSINIKFGVGNTSDYTSLCGKTTPYQIINISANADIYLNVGVVSGNLISC